MTTIFHWFVAVYLVLSDVHTFYSLPTIDDNAVSFRFSPPFHCSVYLRDYHVLTINYEN